MKKFLSLLNSLRVIHWLLLISVSIMGIAGTFSIGSRIEKTAVENWNRQSELDVAIATSAAQNWLAQSETIVSGLTLGFQQSDQISVEEFDNLVFKAEDWNSEFSLDAVAVVRRVLRPQRVQMEQSLGLPFSHVNKTGQAVPDAYVHMVVIHSSDTDGSLRHGVDLLTFKEMGIVPRTAQRVPDQAIMGPAYKGNDGLIYTLVGVGLPYGDRNTIVIGRVNLSEMIETVLSEQLPKGIVLRMSERDDVGSTDTLLRPIYGALEPAANVVHTIPIRITRGQARWNYNWDVTTEYLGGAPTANATMFQIGGLIITILVVYSIGLLSVQNVIIKRTVEQRTKKLTAEMSERKKAEETLREARDTLEQRVEIRTEELQQAVQETTKAAKAKSEFLSSMSHELRTPLNAILGFTQLLNTDPNNPLTKMQIDATEQVLKAGDHLLSLIDEVLDLAEIEVKNFSIDAKPQDPSAVINTCAAIALNLAEKKNLMFNNRTVSWNLPHINIDAIRFQQVMLNLLSNAVKYNRDGGTVTLSAAESEGNALRFMVTDTGHGIAKEKQTQVFTPFSRLGMENSEITGTGIGLTITKDLVEAMGGSIGFESTLEVGSTFWVDFPIASGTVSVKDRRKEFDADTSLLTTHKVLCVEDNPSSLKLLESIIDRIPDMTMISANTGELGIDLAEIHNPDVILMDINLPGITGLEALDRLQESTITKDIPVIALTARASATDKKLGLAQGFNNYLTKPINVNEITTALNQALFKN